MSEKNPEGNTLPGEHPAIRDEANEPPSLPSFALVYQHMLSPIQMHHEIFAPNAESVRDVVRVAIAENGGNFDVVDRDGNIVSSIIFGAGMFYTVMPWDEFQVKLKEAQRKNAEAAAARNSGLVVPGSGGALPLSRRPRS